ncbi:MAG: OmpA family protein, partial [Thiolinea sp.]
KNSADQCPETVADAKVNEAGCELDDDNDGVKNSADKCPTTPAGASVDAEGCELDSDNDGVKDSADKCPDTAAGTEVDAEGCDAIEDGDKDGVADENDLCPETATGNSVNQVGCARDANISLQGVQFETSSDVLTADSRPILDEAAATLRKFPELKVEVSGHTDSAGGRQANQNLSQARAESVRDYLVSKGANADSLTPKGYGEDQPIANNGTRQGRAINRRVELKILE